MAEFKESEHPRDKDGKFTDKGSGQGWTKEKAQRLLKLLRKKEKIKFSEGLVDECKKIERNSRNLSIEQG